MNYDESMIIFYGRHCFKQIIRGKSIRLRLRVEVIIQDDETTMNKFLEKQQLRSFISWTTCQRKNEIYLISYFLTTAGVALLNHLREIIYDGTGTMRDNHIPNTCPLVIKKDFVIKQQVHMNALLNATMAL